VNPVPTKIPTMPRTNFATLLAALLACSLLAHSANGQAIYKLHTSLFDRLMDAFDEPFIGLTDEALEDHKLLSIGCLPARSLHKAIHQGDNETSVTFLVSRACGPQVSSQKLHSIHVTVDPEAGELDVQASVDGEGEDQFSERLLLPQRAVSDAVTSSYDEATHVLTVRIPLKPINKREVPLSIVPKTIETEAPKTAQPAEGRDVPAGKDKDAVKDKIQALEEELARIKGSVFA